MKFLLDTNVLKEIGKSGCNRNVAAWLDTIDDVDLTISVISIREICKGIEKKRKNDPVLASKLQESADRIFEAFQDRTLDIDEAVARLWGSLLGQNDKHVDDTGLAATAYVHGLVVVTRNETDFKRRGVRILNPFKRPVKITP